MVVLALYMENPELFRHRARVTKIGLTEINKKKYRFVQLNETIFHPRGGGQPSDEGTINGIKVLYVHKELLDKTRVDLFEILHCFEENAELPFKEGDVVELVVDETKRRLCSRMHTAGHLLAEVVKEEFPALEAYQGNHDPKDGYVKFKMLSEIDIEKESFLQKIRAVLNAWLDKDLEVSIVKLASGMRAIEFNKKVMSCGGTHVAHLKEIGDVHLTDVSINKKDKTLTIKYRL